MPILAKHQVFVNAPLPIFIQFKSILGSGLLCEIVLILGKKYLPIENRYLGEVQKTDNANKRVTTVGK